MKQEKEALAQKQKNEYLLKVQEKENQKKELEEIKSEFSLLFTMNDPHKRGKQLEEVLNRLFKASGVLVKEAFTLKGNDGEGIVEQVDGVVEIDGHLYLVEMKWWSKPLGNADVSQHLVRIFNRGHARGIFISASGYTEPAIRLCQESLSQCTIVLSTLEEIFRIVDNDLDLVNILKEKIQAAIIDKNPYHIPKIL
jgi:restriction system protein